MWKLLRSIDLPILDEGIWPLPPKYLPRRKFTKGESDRGLCIAFKPRLQMLFNVFAREQTSMRYVSCKRRPRPLPLRACNSYIRFNGTRRYERNENSSLSRGNTAFSFISKFNLKSLESKIAKLLSLLISNNCKLRIFSF